MFLHTNFYPKFTLDVPADFRSYSRRWQLAQPGRLPFADLAVSAGIPPDRDLEREVYQVWPRGFVTRFWAPVRTPQGPECETLA